MEQILTDAITHGGPTALAVLAAGAFLGLLLFREDIVGGRRYRRDLAKSEAETAEWKALAVKAVDAGAVQASQNKALADSVETLTALVRRR